MVDKEGGRRWQSLKEVQVQFTERNRICFVYMFDSFCVIRRNKEIVEPKLIEDYCKYFWRYLS